MIANDAAGLPWRHCSWGRPEREIRTPVNMENCLHRDNGEGVAPASPLPARLVYLSPGAGRVLRNL
jgi:hypothetical protein